MIRDNIEQWLEAIPTTGCLEWQRSRTRGGYGRFRFEGRIVYLHRYVYEKSHGPIPEGLLVRHKCDNPPCGNPDHLEVGTSKDNALDRDSRGRSGTITHGRYVGKSYQPPKWGPNGRRFSDSDVREIRSLASAGVLLKDLAARYGVSAPSIGRIVSRKRYPDVE